MAESQPTQRDLFEQPKKRDLRDRTAYRRAQREQRLAAGLCILCGKAPHIPSAQWCEACAARRKTVHQKHHQAKRVSRGKTPVHVPPANPVSADMKAYKRAWRARRRAGENCTTCNGPRDVPGKVRCSTCHAGDNKAVQRKKARPDYRERADKANSETRAKRAAWEAAGLCNWCGGQRDQEGKKRCGKCNAYMRQKLREQAARRQAAGLCPGCGKRRPAAPKRRCEPCLKEARLAYVRAFRRNPEKYIARLHRRRRLLFLTGQSFTGSDWLMVKAAQDFRCLMCNRREPEIKLTVDHIVPVIKGGGNGPDSIQGLCDSCNKSKGARCLDLRHKARWPHLYPTSPD